MRFAFSVTFLVFSLCGSSLIEAQNVEYREVDSQELDEKDGSAAGNVETAEVVQLAINLTNDFRHKQGLESVQKNNALQQAAQYFADYMARTGRYGHTADGNRPSDRAKEHGYEYCLVSENIAYQFNTAGFQTQELAEGFVQGWIDSPKHRENMLEPVVTDIGLAVAKADESGKYFAVQMFGRPRSASLKFQVLNHSERQVKYLISEKSFDLPPNATMTHERCKPDTVEFQINGQKVKRELSDGSRYTITESENGELAVATSQY